MKECEDKTYNTSTYKRAEIKRDWILNWTNPNEWSNKA